MSNDPTNNSNEKESSIGDTIWSTLDDGKYTIGLNVIDFVARVGTAAKYFPKLQAASPVAQATGNAAPSGTSNLGSSGAPLSQLDTTTDGVGYVEAASPTCNVGGIVKALIFQEIIGSSIIILVQAYSIYEIWKELSASTKVINESQQKLETIEKDMQNLMVEIGKLNQCIEEIKDKKPEHVTMVDTQELLFKINKASLLCIKVYQPISDIRLTVDGKIQTLKAAKSSLIRDEFLIGGQIVSHLAEFCIYASLPMGIAFWGVKGIFTAVYAGVMVAKGTQHRMTNNRLKKLKAKWLKLEKYNEEITKIVNSMLEKQTMLEDLHEKSKQRKKTN